MQARSGNLEQIKNLLNKQINQTHQIQFRSQHTKVGNSSGKSYKAVSSMGIGNFSEIQEAATATPKHKFIQINETPQHAEFAIEQFGNRKNNVSMNYVKQPFYSHQKSKSSASMPRHVSIMCSNEDASCCSRGTMSGVGNGTTKFDRQKKQQVPVSAMSQISLFSHDASNLADNMTTFYSNNAPRTEIIHLGKSETNNIINNNNVGRHELNNGGRPETSHTYSKKNISYSRYQIMNNDDIDDQTTSIQSPVSHQRILSASINADIPLTGSAFLGNQRSTSNQKDQNRPKSQNQAISKSSASQPRPFTAVHSKIQEEEEHNISQKKTPQNTQKQNFFLSRVYSGIQKKKTQNHVQNSGGNSSIFELYDEKMIQQAAQQKQKAINKFLMIRNSAKTLRSSLAKQSDKSRQNNEGSDNSLVSPTNPTSSTNLIELTKQRNRVIQEILQEMQLEQKDFVTQIVDAESKSIVFTSQFIKMEKLIDSNDLQLLTFQLIFLAKSSLAVQDYDKATYFLQQAKVITDMSKKIAPLKSQIFLILGEVALKISKYREAVKIFKKVLQYAWYFKLREFEIEAYEKIGLSYFYLQDINLSDFYHTRYTKQLYEITNSHIRNISQENINEYFTKCEYNLNSITPILMVHLSLPVQYSLDKVQQGLRESFLKQEQKQNKRNSKINEKLENLAKESQKQVENFVQSRQKIFLNSNAVKIIDLLMEDREFLFETDTPKQFEDNVEINEQQQKMSELQQLDQSQSSAMHKSSISFAANEKVQKKRVWEAPVLRKITYDISKLGPIEDPRPSQRVFEDITKYKLSLDKKIEILQKQKIDLGKIMEKVNYLVSNNQKYSAQMNQRVRMSHLTPNRSDIFKYNTPFYMISQINRAYNRFLHQLKKALQIL